MTKPLVMLDLFSGLGGASAAMKDRGWNVTRVDIEPSFAPDVVADVTTYKWVGDPPDLIWASPPCTEFARESMPWCRTGRPPDLTLLRAAQRIIEQARPRFWVIENVKGAQKWFGRAPMHIGPYYLWGWFPWFRATLNPSRKKKESYSSKDEAKRALIPYEISLALAKAVENSKHAWLYFSPKERMKC